MSPGLLVEVALVLVLAQVFYGLWPYRNRRFASALALSAIGAGAGQLWQLAGLPGVNLGEANLVPAVLFAAALQPLADRLRLGSR